MTEQKKREIRSFKVMLRSQFLKGLGTMKGYKTVVGLIHNSSPQRAVSTTRGRLAALKRHLEFFNAHPYIAAPILGVTLAPGRRANGVSLMPLSKGLKLG